MWTITINPHCLLLESIWITIRLPFEFISTRFARDCSRVGRQENIWKTSAKVEHLRSTAELRTGKRVPLESHMAGWASATFNTCFNPNEADLPTSEAASEVTSGLFCGEASTDRCELCLSQLASVIWIPMNPLVKSPRNLLGHGRSHGGLARRGTWRVVPWVGPTAGATTSLRSAAASPPRPSRCQVGAVGGDSTWGDLTIDAIQ